ncbi:MAG: tRNA pseudouridine(55) synthase TruB [Fimbriimonadaceae bacterium]|nr:tRNA pseudouridine(55) synthase TruB [Fimbriimonadaceae bacterium]
MLGILLVDKPKGITSHDVINILRRRFETKRIGHAGTLDPLGTGLLVVAVGPATRFLQYLPLEPKVYVCEFTFGQTSDTYDGEGTLSDRVDVPLDLCERIELCKPTFMGLIEQLPPIYSAVKVQGKPMYKYARAGQDVHREPRSVHIGRYELLSIEENKATFEIECSGGTYMRSLAHDLGEAVGCGAYMSSLLRTRAGKFRVEDAVALETVTPSDLIPLSEALPPMPLLRLSPSDEITFRQGQRLAAPETLGEPLVALQDLGGYVIGVGRIEEGKIQPECVLPLEAVTGN